MKITITVDVPELDTVADLLGRAIGEALGTALGTALDGALRRLATATQAANWDAWGAAKGACAEPPAGPAPAKSGNPDPAPPPPAPAPKPRGLWTAERLALVRRDWPADVPADEILRRLNALPGGPIAGVKSVELKASELKVRRTVRRRAVIESGPFWSPEREALLRRDWPAGVETAEVVAALNRLPGPAITAAAAAGRANRLYLRRPNRPERPLGLVSPAAPPPLLGRDGAPSVAAREVVAELASAMAPVPATEAEVADWAAQHAPDCLELAPAEFLPAVNRARDGLPPFAIVPAQPRFAALPRAREAGHV